MSQYSMTRKDQTSSVDLMEHINKQAGAQGKIPPQHLSHVAKINAYLVQVGAAPKPFVQSIDGPNGIYHQNKLPESQASKNED